MRQSDLDRLKAAAHAGEVAAFVPLADEMEINGHKHGPELQDLAITIRDSTDWPTVFTAIAVFNELMRDP